MEGTKHLNIYTLTIVAVIGLIGGCAARPQSAPPVHSSLVFLGATQEKELYMTIPNKTATFYYALGFGCPYHFGPEQPQLSLAKVETIEEFDLVSSYLATVEGTDYSDYVWTSGVSRLGKIPNYWASTGQEITSFPAPAVGDWSPPYEGSPALADYNCVVIAKGGFTFRPCHQGRSYLCEKRL